jgi:nitrate reductase NapAB chaperone NapD
MICKIFNFNLKSLFIQMNKNKLYHLFQIINHIKNFNLKMLNNKMKIILTLKIKMIKKILDKIKNH